MKQIMRCLAIAAVMLPGLAAAQVPQFPQTVPANTVLGRLGIGAGPVQAIPTASLLSKTLLDQYGATPGMILYRGASQWQALSPSVGLLFNNGTTPSWISPVPIANGGTGQITASAARAASGLNIDSYTGHGNSDYTILATDRTVGTTATLTATRTWTLPAASSVNPGQVITVGDYFGGTSASNKLTVSRAGSDTINGANTIDITTAFGRLDLKSDGVSKWSALTASGSAASLLIKTPADYGAVCDGTTDDSIALQAWLDGIRGFAAVGWGLAGKTCIFGNNTVYGGVFASMMALRSGTIIRGNYMTLKLKNSGQQNYGLFWYDGAGHPDQVSGATNTDVSQLIIDGNRANQTNTLGSAGLFDIRSSNRVTLRDVTAMNGRADGFYIGGDSGTGGNTTFFRLENAFATGNYRTGLSVVGATRGTITGSYFNSTSNTNNDGTQCGVDFEADGSSTTNTFITIENSSAVANGGTLSTSGGSGFCFFGGFNSNLTASNLTASSNQKYGVWGGTPGEVTLTGLRGVSNGTALITGATDWLPSNVKKGAADGCGTGFSCVGIPN